MTVRATPNGQRKHLTLRLAVDDAVKLEALAKLNERTVSAEVRRAIQAHLKAAA